MTAAVETTSAVTVDRDYLDKLILTDRSLDAFVGLVTPESYIVPYPEVYRALWIALTNDVLDGKAFTQHKWALAGSRGFVKTFLLKMLVTFAILYSRRSIYVVICSNETKAKNFVDDVWKVLESPNIVAMYGAIKSEVDQDTKTLKRFTRNGTRCAIMAVGAGQPVRGANLDFKRPDFLVMDDLLDLEDTKTSMKFDDLKKSLVSTTLRSLDLNRYFACYLGNMYASNCLTTWLVNNVGWKSIRLAPVLADGSLLWPELVPMEVLQRQYKEAEAEGTLDAFYAEVLNTPMTEMSQVLDYSTVQSVDSVTLGSLHLGSFILIDPAGNKSTSDANAIGYFEFYDDLRHRGGETVVMREVLAEQLSPAKVIEQTLRWCMQKGCRDIFVEAVAYQSTLVFWMQHYIVQLGLTNADIRVHEILPKGKAGKNLRILGGMKSLISERVVLEKTCYSAVMTQVRAFRLSAKDNVDDVLDLLVYADELRINPEQRKKIRSNIDLQIERMPTRGSLESLIEQQTFNDCV